MPIKTRWHTFEAEGRVVEGQIFEPANGATECILFCPGFPGRGATHFEQRHAASLVKEGFAVVVLRHNGTRLDTPDAFFMINNAARMAYARKAGQHFLGHGPSSVGAWLHEPATALRCLEREFPRIRLFASSFGALPALWSLSRPEAPTDSVADITFLAGAQGIIDDTPGSIMRIWKPEFLADERFADRIAIEPPELTVATLESTYRELPFCMQALPAHIHVTYLVVERDELLSVEDTRRFMDATDQRGTLKIDTIDRAHPNHGLLAHDMPDYPTEYLLDLLDESPGHERTSPWNN